MVDARAYHEETNHTPEKLRSASVSMDERNRPRPFKSYTELENISLPEIAPKGTPALEAIAVNTNDSIEGSESLDMEAIATLCYLAAGITQETEYKGEQVRFRAASCTGNLHHIDLYLVCGELDDLEAGVYHFDPVAFALDILRTGDFRGNVARASGDGAVATAPLTMIATSTWWRNAWKYTERTYRHAFWDSGTVVANLLAAAHGSDQNAQVVTAFEDDALVELLGIDPEDEAPLAAVTIGTGSEVPEVIDVEPIDPEEAPLSPDPRDHPLIHDAWQQSRLEDRKAVTNWRDQCLQSGPIGRVGAGEGERVDLDPVDRETATARPLLETVERRGSKRQYRERGPTRRQLGTILDRATRGVPGDWNGGNASGLDYLDCYVLCTDVQEVPDGLYQYHPEDDALERLDDVTSTDQQRLALGQDWAGEAHVNIYLMADVETIVEHLGNRGYRLAQLEAGIILGRLYIATAAHRLLGGTGLTFFDERVNEYLSPRASEQFPMTMFAFGKIDVEKGQRF